MPRSVYIQYTPYLKPFIISPKAQTKKPQCKKGPLIRHRQSLVRVSVGFGVKTSKTSSLLKLSTLAAFISFAESFRPQLQKWCRSSCRSGSPLVSSNVGRRRLGLTPMKPMRSPWLTRVTTFSLSSHSLLSIQASFISSCFGLLIYRVITTF